MKSCLRTRVKLEIKDQDGRIEMARAKLIKKSWQGTRKLFSSLAWAALASWRFVGLAGFDMEFIGMQYVWKQRCL